MKKLQKLLVGLMIAVLLTSTFAVTAFALETEAGTTVNVSFSIPGVFGVQGGFEFSNRDLFSGVSYRNDSSLAGSLSNDRAYLYGSEQANVVITLTLNVKASAQPGDQCKISFTYKTADLDGHLSSELVQSQTVVIKASSTPVQPDEPDEPTPSGGETPTPPVRPQGSTTPPANQAPGIDYTELIRQMNIAESLNENDYTADSWDAMMQRYNEGQRLLSSRDQTAVDNGAAALEKAISELVKLNTAALKKAAEEGNRMIDDDRAKGSLWKQLFDALDRVDEVLATRDQKQIDDLTKEIEDLIAAIKKDAEENAQVKEIVKEVEVLPDGLYCNIPIHKVWPILFFISLGINLILIGLIIAFFAKRKKNEKDDTPVVDYDIGDD